MTTAWLRIQKATLVCACGHEQDGPDFHEAHPVQECKGCGAAWWTPCAVDCDSEPGPIDDLPATPGNASVRAAVPGARCGPGHPATSINALPAEMTLGEMRRLEYEPPYDPRPAPTPEGTRLWTENEANSRLRRAAREYAEAWHDYKNESRKSQAVGDLELEACAFAGNRSVHPKQPTCTPVGLVHADPPAPVPNEEEGCSCGGKGWCDVCQAPMEEASREALRRALETGEGLGPRTKQLLAAQHNRWRALDRLILAAFGYADRPDDWGSMAPLQEAAKALAEEARK